METYLSIDWSISSFLFIFMNMLKPTTMMPLKIWFLRKTNSWTCRISNICCCYSTDKGSWKNQNKHSKFDTSKLMSNHLLARSLFLIISNMLLIESLALGSMYLVFHPIFLFIFIIMVWFFVIWMQKKGILFILVNILQRQYLDILLFILLSLLPTLFRIHQSKLSDLSLAPVFFLQKW